MKILKSLLIAVAVLCLTACGGSASYNASTCKTLQEKIQKNEQFTESDYDQLIDQLGAICKVMVDKKKQIGDDREKTMEFAQSQEGQELVGYLMGFSIYIDYHRKDLSKDNLKKLDDLEKELKELK